MTDSKKNIFSLKPTKMTESHFVDFDGKEKAVEEPTYTMAELAEAQQNSYQQGLHQGRSLERQEIETQLLHSVMNFQGKWTEFIDEERGKRLEVQKRAVMLAKTIACKIGVGEIEKKPLDWIEMAMNKVSKTLLDTPKIAIYVHPAHVSPLKERFAQREEVDVKGDEKLGPVDCWFDWDKGGAEFLLTDMMKNIESIIQDSCGEEKNTTEEGERAC